MKLHSPAPAPRVTHKGSIFGEPQLPTSELSPTSLSVKTVELPWQASLHHTERIMSTDTRIRVIKLAERKRRAKARIKKGRDSAQRTEQDKAPDAAATVTGWVDEMRRQKHERNDATSDFNNLFEDAS